jgi:hypothetical protein
VSSKHRGPHDRNRKEFTSNQQRQQEKRGEAGVAGSVLSSRGSRTSQLSTAAARVGLLVITPSNLGQR